MVSQRDRWAAELEALLARELRVTSTRLHQVYASMLTMLVDALAGYIDQYDDLSYSRRLEVERLMMTAQQIAAELEPGYSAIATLIDRQTTLAAELGYAGVWYQLEQVEGLRAGLMGLDRRFVEAAVSAPVPGARLSERLYVDRMRLAEDAQREIIRGIVEGRGYRATAAKLADRSEASYRNALRITRTESGRARSVATLAGYEEAAALGVQIEKRWVATMDSRTRRDHRILDGQTVPLNGVFVTPQGYTAPAPRMFGVPSEDINCRCTMETIVEGMSSDARRDNITGETIPYMAFTDWAEQNGII